MSKPAREEDIRDTRVVIYMTKADADLLHEYAEAAGFPGRSGFIVGLLERLIIGSFSIRVFLQLGLQLQRTSKFRVFEPGFYFGLRPLPSFSTDEIQPEDEKKALTSIRKEITTEAKNT